MKLLLHFMEYELGRNITLSTESENRNKDKVDADRGFATPMTKESYSKSVPCNTICNHLLNVLQEACLLPRSILLSEENGIQSYFVLYLLSDDASQVEAAVCKHSLILTSTWPQKNMRMRYTYFYIMNPIVKSMER